MLTNVILYAFCGWRRYRITGLVHWSLTCGYLILLAPSHRRPQLAKCELSASRGTRPGERPAAFAQMIMSGPGERTKIRCVINLPESVGSDIKAGR